MIGKYAYLAGPMRGIRDFNFPAFHDAASQLRKLGLVVFSAAEYEESIFGKGFNKSEHGDLKDIEHLEWDFRAAFNKDCHCICTVADLLVCLPGWEKSKGATAEVAIGRTLGLPVLAYPSMQTIPAVSHKPEVCANPHIGIGGAPLRASILPTDGKDRKSYPVASGLLDYFPDACAEISHVSYVANEQHNPGKPMHWDRSKSQDEADTMQRHFLERGKMDADGLRHSAKMAWRALALLQKELEGK